MPKNITVTRMCTNDSELTGLNELGLFWAVSYAKGVVQVGGNTPSSPLSTRQAPEAPRVGLSARSLPDRERERERETERGRESYIFLCVYLLEPSFDLP